MRRGAVLLPGAWQVGVESERWTYQGALDLCSADVVPADDDDVIGPARDVIVTVGIAARVVARQVVA